MSIRSSSLARLVREPIVRVEDVVSDGDVAVVRWTARATHHGGFGADRTDRKVSVRGITWLEFRGGKLVRGWDGWNYDGLRRQILDPQPSGGDREPG